MRRYKNAFLFVGIVVSIPSAFLFATGIQNLILHQSVFWGTSLLLWWGAYAYLRTDKVFSFWGSFLLINLFWWPLFIQVIRRIFFVFKYAGMEEADGTGSPLAFLLGTAVELLFFIPLSIAIGTGIIAIKNFRKISRPTAESS